MEDRDDLRALLLDGLPATDRQATLDTISQVRAAKLAKLRAADSPQDPPDGTAEDELDSDEQTAC